MDTRHHSRRYEPEDFFCCAHRTRTARRASSLRFSGVSRFALALPPFRPQATKRRRISSGNFMT
jgi:hypothetical protein